MVRKVIVAEDDADTSFLLQNILCKAGYEVECLREASKLVEQGNVWPDLFILDKEMPCIDGIAICKFLRLKEETKNIPIIMISGRQFRRKAIKAGANAFLQKPFNTEKLLMTIKGLA